MGACMSDTWGKRGMNVPTSLDAEDAACLFKDDGSEEGRKAGHQRELNHLPHGAHPGATTQPSRNRRDGHNLHQNQQ